MSFIASVVSYGSKVLRTVFRVSTHEELLREEQARLNRYQENWDWYNGFHWKHSRESGDMPYVNWAKRVVNRLTYALVGIPPKLRVDETHKDMLKYHQDTVRASGKSIFLDAVQMGSVTGDLYLKAEYDATRPIDDQVYFRVLESGKCFPIYRRGELIAFRHYYAETSDQGEITLLYEHWTKTEWYIARVKDDEIVSNNGKKTPHSWGFVPFVHVANNKSGNLVFGISDIEDLREVNREFNKNLVRYRDAAEYDGDPQLAFFGFDAEEIERGADQAWGGLPIEGRIEVIGASSDYPALQKLMEILKEAIHINASMPKGALGDETDPYSSSAALQTKLLPIEENLVRKRAAYSEGFEKILAICLQIRNAVQNLGLEKRKFTATRMKPLEKAEVFDPEGEVKIETEEVVSTRPYYEVYVKFQDSLPKNRAEMLVSIGQEMQLELETRRGALERLGEENIDQKMLDLAQDFQERLDRKIREAEALGEVSTEYQGDTSTDGETNDTGNEARKIGQGADTRMGQRRIGSKRNKNGGFKNDRGEKTQ
jgi:hypothetical protein